MTSHSGVGADRQLSPGDAGNLYLLSRAYLQTKQFDKALVAFDELERADPNSPWVHLLKGQAYDGLASMTSRSRSSKPRGNSSPTTRRFVFRSGFCIGKPGRLAEAEAELAKALELDPGFREAKFYLADTYLTDQKPQQSIPLLQSIVVQDPNYVRARLDLGKAYFQMERYPEAALNSKPRYAWSQIAGSPLSTCPGVPKAQSAGQIS